MNLHWIPQHTHHGQSHLRVHGRLVVCPPCRLGTYELGSGGGLPEIDLP